MTLHLIMGNYATDKTPAIRRWLEKRLRFHVHFTLTSALWINFVERWFATPTAKQFLELVLHRRLAFLAGVRSSR